MLTALARSTLLAALALTLLAGCGRTETRADAPPEEDDDGPPPVTPPGPATSLDVLFVVDNGFTGGAAQRLLSQAIPYMVDRLVNPRCVNGRGQIVDGPPNLETPCEVGIRDFAPQTDVRFGVISSSIGGHGADSCSPMAPDYDVTQDDGARLLTRADDDSVVPTYEGLGFLAWDPEGRATPPGESNPIEVGNDLRTIVRGVGTAGCSFNAPLEAAYRFLVDPEPPVSIQVVGGSAERQGIDTSLLEQREAFLRPDSAVLVVIVSDRDDCSIREEGQFYLAAQRQLGGMPFNLPPARSECAADPEDACCLSCGEPQGNCPPDPNCDGMALPPSQDPISLRCFDQKRRFGIDFNYPLDRYLDGFSEITVQDAVGEVVDNPLFAVGRRPERVMVAALTGVPWPNIAIAPNDLAAGLDPAPEVAWERLLPQDDGTPPSDPLMIPSVPPRTGTSPVTEEALAPPEAAPLTNSTNSHEHALPATPQFSCVYPLDPPVNCSGGRCECGVPELQPQNPACQDPMNGQYDQVQRYGRATPAPRLLEFVRDLGPQGILGTLCTGRETAPAAAAFGFKPSVDAMMRSIRRQLVPFASP